MPEESVPLKKKCPKCRRTRPLTEFYRNRSQPDGRHPICRVCRLKETQQTYTADYPRWWSRVTRNQHKRYGHKVLISIDELANLAHETTHCMYCGVELRWNPRGDDRIYPDSPSLDRYDNGNVLDTKNVRIICHPCNAGKGIDTYEGYVNRCRNVVKIYGEKPKSTM